MQDTTEIALSAHARMTGLGPSGNGTGRGFLLQTVLAVVPETHTVLGCLAQQPFLRVPAPAHEQRYQRRHRAQRETDVWMRMVEQIGTLAGAGLRVRGGIAALTCGPSFAAAARPRPTLSSAPPSTAAFRLKSRPPVCSWIRCARGRARTSSPLTCQARMGDRPGRRRCSSAVGP